MIGTIAGRPMSSRPSESFGHPSWSRRSSRGRPTQLRYDRRVSGRRDARPALTVFGLLAADLELFEIRGMPSESHRRSVDLLARYVDQTFSWVDAIVLLSADDDRRVERLWTVDSTLGSYRFSHQVVVSSPGSRTRARRAKERMVERETGFVAPGTKHRVEFSYRLA
jgi:hypothetical protein